MKTRLVRAVYDWALDCNLTPQLLVSLDSRDVQVPPGFAQDEKIVLNIHPQSVQGLQMDDTAISFSARFAGRPFDIVIPPRAVLAVFARENSRGVIFHNDDNAVAIAPTPSSRADKPNKSGDAPHLKLVK